MKKTVAVVLCLLTVVATAVTAAAIFYGQARTAEGASRSETVDRVNFTFEGIRQRFQATDGAYVAEIRFTAEKTEPDFYAVMNELTLDGMDFDRLEIVPEPESGGLPFVSAQLPVADGKPTPAVWNIRIYFHASAGQTLRPSLSVDFTSGVKEQAASRRIFEQPLEFTVDPSA